MESASFYGILLCKLLRPLYSGPQFPPIRKKMHMHTHVFPCFYYKDFYFKKIKSFCIKLCQVFLGWGQAAQARVSSPPGGKLPRGSFTPRGASCPGWGARYPGVSSPLGGKLPRGSFTPGGQAAKDAR